MIVCAIIQAMRVWLWIALLLSSLPGIAGQAVPFQTRDQNPLNLIYGLPTPTAANVTASGAFTLTWSVNISNTLVVDRAGDESLTIDGESHETELTAAYGIGDRWALQVKLPLIAYTPGMLDRPIEKYHDWLGLNQGDRLQTPRDRLLFVYERNGIERLRLDRRENGLGDIQLIAGRQMHSSAHSACSLWAGVKLPTGDSDSLTGSGAVDVSLWGAGSRMLNENWQLYGTAGLLLLGNGDVLPEQQEDSVFFGSLGVQWARWKTVTIKTQLEWHTDFYKDTGARFLGDVLQLTFGPSWEISPDLFLDFAVSEDIKVEASPDVNFNFTLRAFYD